MNAVDFLIKEHNKIRKAFAEISNKVHRDLTKREMFEALSHELVRHETMEQEVWYPKLKTNEKLRDVIKHLVFEEKTAAKAIKEIKKIKIQEAWEEKFLKLKKDVEHHATEEETKLFPKVERLLNEAELNRIGKELREFKLEFEEAR
ncbi:MAG: hemerythrin domain-containing protein [Gammaproteobacteria bacterium]|nr:hemerythrin domain-containing protein [Gammaproteobacteria bacterium]